MTEDCKITFIIPTIGRKTLSKTIQCLINQTCSNWKAIIVFDGISPTIKTRDPRIFIVKSSKLGKCGNVAGLVRNYGICYAKTEWVAFVHDDDCLSRDYVEIFYNELSSQPPQDIIIFRMILHNNVLPELQTDMFYKCSVGISFVARKEIFDKGHVFIPSNTEDFDFLNEAKNKNYKIMISPHITYFVRNYESIERKELGNRVFL
jgi:glycosyltransferase involved in cell wall biosynthesis